MVWGQWHGVGDGERWHEQGRGEDLSLNSVRDSENVACVQAWEWVAETRGLPVMGTVLAWVSKSNTGPIPAGPMWQNPRVHPNL